MKGKIKKVIGATLLSAMSVTAIGCSANENKLAKNIDKSMAEFVSSINNLDYVETGRPTNQKVGKIVETNSTAYGANTHQITTRGNQVMFLNDNISEAEVENTITKPTERTDENKLFILSETPFISLTSNDNSTSLSLNVKFSTDKIENTSTEIDEKINTLILKRSILMIYVNEIYNNNVNLSEEDKKAINAYVNVIKENTSFLNGNRGMVKNQLKLASDLVENNSNENLVNYYIIKSGEALETRASKLDSSISAIDSIINIIEANLAETSTYYNTKLSTTYTNIISNIRTSENTVLELDGNSSNKQVADSISNSLDFLIPLHQEEIVHHKVQPRHHRRHRERQRRNNTVETENQTNSASQENTTTPNTNNTANSTVNNAEHLNDTKALENTAQTQVANQTNNSNSIKKIRNNRQVQNGSVLNNVNEDKNTNLVQNQTKNTQNSLQNAQNTNVQSNTNQNFRTLELTKNSQNVNSNSNDSTTKNDAQSGITRSNINMLKNRKNRQANKNLRSNIMDEDKVNNSKTIRAERTPERVTNEQYTSANTHDEIRATRMPYKSQSSIQR